MVNLTVRLAYFALDDILRDLKRNCLCLFRRIFRGDCRSENYYHMIERQHRTRPSYYYADHHSTGIMAMFEDPLNLLVFCIFCFAAGIFLASEYVHRVFPGAFRKGPPTLAERRHSVMRQEEAYTAREPYGYQSRRRPSQLPPVEEPLSYNAANLGGSSPSTGPDAMQRGGDRNNDSMETLQAKVRIKGLEENSADWVNKVLNWLYHRYNTTPEFSERYLVSLNEYAKYNANQLTCLLTFERLLPSAQGVKVSQVSVEAGPEHVIVIECFLECRQFAFEVTGTDTAAVDNYQLHRQSTHAPLHHSAEPITYRANVPELRTRLRLVVIGTEPSTIRAGLFDTEKLDVECTPIGPASAVNNARGSDDQALQTMIVEQAIAQCMLNCKTEFKVQGSVYRGFPQSPAPVIVGSSAAAATSPSNWSDSGFSNGHAQNNNLLSTPGGSNTSRSIESSPIFMRAGTNPKLIDQTLRALQNPKHIQYANDGIDTDELLVKVVGAKNLLDNVQEPFCVVELDEPAQKYTTNVVKDTPRNPYWNENFLLVLQPRVSCEILFEVHDKKKPKKKGFIGTAIVSAVELLKQPSRRMECPLTRHTSSICSDLLFDNRHSISRPYFEDEVSGTITVEFLTLHNGQPIAPATTSDSSSYVRQQSEQQVVMNSSSSQPTQLLNEFNSGSVSLHGHTSGSVGVLGACAGSRGSGGSSPTAMITIGGAQKGDKNFINKINPVKALQRARSASRGRESAPNSRGSSPMPQRRSEQQTSANADVAVDLHGHASSMAVGVGSSGRDSRQSDNRSDITSTSITVGSVNSAPTGDQERQHSRSLSRRDSLKETLGKLRRRISAGGRRAKSVDRATAAQERQQREQQLPAQPLETTDTKYQYDKRPSSPTYLRMHEDKWQIPSDASSANSPTGGDGEFGVVLITKQRLKTRSKSVGPEERDDDGQATPTSVKDWVKHPRASFRGKKQQQRDSGANSINRGNGGLSQAARATGGVPVLNYDQQNGSSNAYGIGISNNNNASNDPANRSVVHGYGPVTAVQWTH